MRGHLRVEARNVRTGKIVWRDEGPNLLLNTIKAQASHLLAGDGASRYINRFQFGAGTLAPQVTDVHLQEPITPVKNVANIVYVDAVTVRFEAFLMNDEANGFPIAEAGLLCADDALVARRVLDTVFSKDSDHILAFGWTIEVV